MYLMGNRECNYFNYMCHLFLYSGCMLTCDKDFCNGASILSETGMSALMLTVAFCMAATHIVLSVMFGFDPFEIYSI